LKTFEEMVSVRIVGVTQPVVDEIPDSEGLISYQARVSNPKNQTNFKTAKGLLNYCRRNQHWSVFEMANVVVEIKAPRDISRQILRHRSANFQELSQRYSSVDDFVVREARLQDETNRQNSIETDDEELKEWWYEAQEEALSVCQQVYTMALEKGIAKECARVVLPEGNTMSTLYMNATVRTWYHYATLRASQETQKEHRMVAIMVMEELKKYFPNVFEADI
jgi:thymidylate synthase (FAD)